MSRPGSAGSSSSPHSVLPPIIKNNKDREFLIGLHSYIDDELLKVASNTPEQRFIVHRAAFDKVIDYVTAYKPLLTAVKAEYEDCIETIQRGQREAFFLSGKVKAMSSEPSTLRNYRKRADELEHKVSVISDDNERLKERLRELRKAREEQDSQGKETHEPPKREIKRDHRTIPGLTLQQSTDLRTLTRELEKLDRQLKELSLAHRTRYTQKDVKNTLKDGLDQKVGLRDDLSTQTEILKMKRHKLKIAVEAAHAYLKIQPPHQTIGEAVVSALARGTQQTNAEQKGGGAEEIGMRGTPSTSFEDDDPTREKEAEMMLEYIEKFNELLDDELYEEAAVHAANSPKGILRTPETLHRFKDLKIQTIKSRSPLLAFCEALISTVPAYGVRPKEYMSAECVKGALEEMRIDLLGHWLAQQRLTETEEIADLVYATWKQHPQAKPCLALAQQMYTRLRLHKKAVICMIQQGRYNQAMDYSQNRGKFTEEDYCDVLAACPTQHAVDLLYDLQPDGQQLLSLGKVVAALTRSSAHGLCCDVLNNLYQTNISGETSSQNLRNGILQDTELLEDEWQEVAHQLHKLGYEDAARETLAAVTVREAIHHGIKQAAAMFDTGIDVENDQEGATNPAASTVRFAEIQTKDDN